MDIQFYGANCVTLQNKQARILIDDTLAQQGGKDIVKPGDIVLQTTNAGSLTPQGKIVIDQPGEYEVSGISIFGIGARAHMDEAGKKSATMYKIIIDDVTVLVAGHIFPNLEDKQLEAIGMVDVLIVPVGGDGFTLDGIGALKVIKTIEPKVVIPTHYESKNFTYEVPQQPLEQAVRSLAMEPSEALPKLRLKKEDLVDGATRLVVLEESK